MVNIVMLWGRVVNFKDLIVHITNQEHVSFDGNVNLQVRDSLKSTEIKPPLILSTCILQLFSKMLLIFEFFLIFTVIFWLPSRSLQISTLVTMVRRPLIQQTSTSSGNLGELKCTFFLNLFKCFSMICALSKARFVP